MDIVSDHVKCFVKKNGVGEEKKEGSTRKNSRFLDRRSGKVSLRK